MERRLLIVSFARHGVNPVCPTPSFVTCSFSLIPIHPLFSIPCRIQISRTLPQDRRSTTSRTSRSAAFTFDRLSRYWGERMGRSRPFTRRELGPTLDRSHRVHTSHHCRLIFPHSSTPSPAPCQSKRFPPSRNSNLSQLEHSRHLPKVSELGW